MHRRKFLQYAALVSMSELLVACGAGSPSGPSVLPAAPVNALAHPVNPALAGSFYKSVQVMRSGTLQDALSDSGLSPSSSLVSYRNPDGSTGRDYLIHTIDGFRPGNGFDFMINNGHYFAPAYNFPVRAKDRIDIYMPAPWNGVSA